MTMAMQARNSREHDALLMVALNIWFLNLKPPMKKQQPAASRTHIEILNGAEYSQRILLQAAQCSIGCGTEQLALELEASDEEAAACSQQDTC